MLRICLYHWIPLADNMLPDIAKSLQLRQQARIVENTVEHVVYSAPLDTGIDNLGKVQVKGKINSRGFSQLIVDVPPPKNMSLGPVIESLLPSFQKTIAEFIFEILPYAVRNKTGVMEESIVSFQRFESKVFETFVDNLSKKFLSTYRVIAIVVDKSYEQDVQAGFIVDNEETQITITNPLGGNYVTCNKAEDVFFFYATDFPLEEQKEFESVIYKYCALVVYAHFVERVVDILKDVRDHIIPLRRQLAIALQRNTEEHFSWMTRVKKYLTYIKIKLPIIQRVKNHLFSASKTGVKPKLELFQNAAGIQGFPSLVSTQLLHIRMKPLDIGGIIEEALARLDNLYSEAASENDVLSNELSLVLQGSLQAEHVLITTRELDASRSMLELDRGGKNRANALKILSVVLSGTLGLQIANEVVSIWNLYSSYKLVDPTSSLLRVAFLLGTPTTAWYFTDKYIQRKSDIFRLVIPITANIPQDAIERYIQNHSKSYNRHEISGQRNVISWNKVLKPTLDKIRNPFLRIFYSRYNFNIIFDYEKRGYIYSITLEAEHNKLRFDVFGLVVQILSAMDESGCLAEYQEKETSLLAEVLIHLGINLSDELIALNKILATTSNELERDLDGYLHNPNDPSMSDDDRIIMQDIIVKYNKYLEWLIDAEENKHKNTPLSLLGRSNIAQKLTILRTMDFDTLIDKAKPNGKNK